MLKRMKIFVSKANDEECVTSSGVAVAFGLMIQNAFTSFSMVDAVFLIAIQFNKNPEKFL